MKDNLDHSRLINVHSFRTLAREALGEDAWNYLDGAAESENSKATNQEALRRAKFVPRVFNDVSNRDQSTTILGTTFDTPVVLAPTSPLRLFHEDAELAQMRAAQQKNALAIYSADAHFDLETAAAASDGRAWFQLYAYGDRQVAEEMLSRVKPAGYTAVVITVDAFYAARRERMMSSQFSMPGFVEMGNLRDLQNNPKFRRPDGSVKRLAFTWADIDWIKKASNLPIVIKGVMHPDDASKCLDFGVSGIVVSNHGGRQLDDCQATFHQLPKISDRVGDQLDVLVDGGFYRGVDVIKAIAMGAKAVLIGRAYVQALAACGQPGIEKVLDMFSTEIDNAMAQLGISNLRQLDREFVDLDLN